MIQVKTIASGSKGNCYHLSSGKHELLIECGIKWRDIKAALNFDIARIKACCISHAHRDHCLAVREVLLAGIPVIANATTASRLNVPERSLSHKINVILNGQGLKHDFARTIFWRVYGFPLRHDEDYDCTGYMIEDGDDQLIFITDTGFSDHTFPDCSILMIEANFSEKLLHEAVDSGTTNKTLANRIYQHHMSIERVVELIRKSKMARLREVRLLHLSGAHSDEALFKRLVQEVAGVPVYV